MSVSWVPLVALLVGVAVLSFCVTMWIIEKVDP